jgi:antitoxin component YwqK of YwqJK toxin-antitoxin module
MKLTAARFIAIFLALCAVQLVHAAQDCDIAGESVSPNNGATTAGKTGMMRCRDRDTKQLVREQELRDGKFMGLTRFYKDGVLDREYSVNEKGNRDGRSREFTKTGQVLRDETYRNSAPVGLVRTWYESGALKRVAFYSDEESARGNEQAYAEFTSRKQLRDLRCGKKPLLNPDLNDAALCGFEGKASTVELFSESGAVLSRTVFLAGERLKEVGFYENGKTSYEEETSGDKRVERNFSREGVKRKEVQWRIMKDKQRLRERELEFHENGSLVLERVWTISQVAQENQLQTEATFFLNGQPRSKTSYSFEGKQTSRDEKRFHDNGQLASQGKYVTEGRYTRLAVGTHQDFNTKGKLIGESIYDGKGRITRERAWDEAGKLERDDEVFEDGSRKAYAR